MGNHKGTYAKQLDQILKAKHGGGGGIYKIRCKINGKIYIGSTGNFERRFEVHILALINDKHHNHRLQEDFNLHGKDAFEFTKIKGLGRRPNRDKLYDFEQMFIDQMLPEYNIQLKVERVYYRQGKKGKVEQIKPAKEVMPTNKGVKRLKEGVTGKDLCERKIPKHRPKKNKQGKKNKEKHNGDFLAPIIKKHRKSFSSNKRERLSGFMSKDAAVNNRWREREAEQRKNSQ